MSSSPPVPNSVQPTEPDDAEVEVEEDDTVAKEEQMKKCWGGWVGARRG